ncbi:MAG: DEAD/DEAH box helicase, partial [Deltaproteobacteria bacterium]
MEGPRGYAVRKRGLSPEHVARIRKELTVRADWDPVKSYGPPPPAFRVFDEDDVHFYVPTFWGRQVFGPPAVVASQGDSCPALCFTGSLKEELEQPRAVKATLQTLADGGGGILAVFTGGGKTCMALWVACQLKLKTLVVVNRTVLMQQWQERIATFVPGARVGTLQGPVQETADKDIVVAMLQSLSQRRYALEGFGFCVIDECNHIAAPTFSQAMLHTNCRFKLGLSATPERKDGLTRVLLWFLGPIFLTMKRRDEQQVRVD